MNLGGTKNTADYYFPTPAILLIRKQFHIREDMECFDCCINSQLSMLPTPTHPNTEWEKWRFKEAVLRVSSLVILWDLRLSIRRVWCKWSGFWGIKPNPTDILFNDLAHFSSAPTNVYFVKLWYKTTHRKRHLTVGNPFKMTYYSAKSTEAAHYKYPMLIRVRNKSCD